MLHYLPVKKETLNKIQDFTQDDEQLKLLGDLIRVGWPDCKEEELTVQNGVLFKGDRVVIPFGMRDELKKKLHASRLGVQACLRRAREVFCWPGMYKEIEELVSKCSVCNTFHQGQQKEAMVAHPIPSRPWESIASDLFEF